MGFRTLEISHTAEIHIKDGQLEITKAYIEKTKKGKVQMETNRIKLKDFLRT